MKAATQDLIDLLATRKFNWCDLYHFALVGGSNLYYATGDVNVNHSSQLYSAGGTTGPYFDRTENRAKCRWKTGLEVDNLTFDVLPGSSTVQGVAFLSAVRQGIFDGADLTVSRAYWPQQSFQTPVVPTGIVIRFAGRVAEVEAGRSLAKFTVNSHLELLNQNMPRNLYQSGCVNTLYDASCGLVKASFGVNGSAASGSTASTINATLAEATGYFDLGVLTFTSGENNGVSRTVKSYTQGSPGTISLISPFPNVPAASDTFTIYPGCDKTQATCALKFDNLAQFRGFPFIPLAETAV